MIKNIIQKLTPSGAATVKAVRTFNKAIEAVTKLGQGYCLDTSFMLIESNSNLYQKLWPKVHPFRYVLWGLTRKTKLDKIGFLNIACAVASYEIYRLILPTDTKIDGFIRAMTFRLENFLTDKNVDSLGLEICNRLIVSESIRDFVCKTVLTK